MCAWLLFSVVVSRFICGQYIGLLICCCDAYITGYIVCMQERSTGCNSGSYSNFSGHEWFCLSSACAGMSINYYVMYGTSILFISFCHCFATLSIMSEKVESNKYGEIDAIF